MGDFARQRRQGIQGRQGTPWSLAFLAWRAALSHIQGIAVCRPRHILHSRLQELTCLPTHSFQATLTLVFVVIAKHTRISKIRATHKAMQATYCLALRFSWQNNNIKSKIIKGRSRRFGFDGTGSLPLSHRRSTNVASSDSDSVREHNTQNRFYFVRGLIL